MPKIRVTLGIGFVGATHDEILDVDEDEWNDCKTNEEREDLINDYWRNWSNNYIDGGAIVIED